MTTDYDAIAGEYKRAKLQPWRTHVELFTLLKLIGDVSGTAVVDLACGEGFYTRRFRLAGAGKTVGVDLSRGMIELAQEEERRIPLGIQYLVGDGRALPFINEFDLASAAYLLNYARNRDDLLAMCRGIFASLRPGGRFVTVNSNPIAHLNSFPSFRKYGFEVKSAGLLTEGSPYSWVFHLGHQTITVENYYMTNGALESTLRAAGFREIKWHPAKLYPEAPADGGYWSDFLDHSPIIFNECTR
jgi:toxoflavin synthase